MADVFKQLIGGHKNRSQKALDKKTRSFLQPEESDYYTKKNIDFDDDDYEVELGTDKDVPNHLQDLEKVSLRELDSKSKDEQLRILKTEYQRAYDKASHLNDMYVSSEKKISNFMIEKRQQEKHMKEIRRFVRIMVSELPGSSELKEMVERGSWEPKEVEPLLQAALNAVVSRLRNLDETISFETQKLVDENLDLKTKILKYRDGIRKLEDIQTMINQRQNGVPVSEHNFEEETEDPFAESEEETPSFEDTFEEETNENNDLEQEAHKPHFADFYEEFTSSYKTLKEEDSIDPKTLEKKVVEKPRPPAPQQRQPQQPVNKPSEKPKPLPPKPMVNFDSASSDAKHPLSPDFVETEKESVLELFDDNISDYINNLSANQEFILGVIGRTGLSRNPDLRDYLTTHEEGSSIYVKGKRFEYQSLSNDVANLRDKGILLDEKVSLGGNGGSSNMIIFELSNIGKQCFKMLFKDDPVVAEKKRIKEHHSSLEHGYLIKDSAKIFREMGFTVHSDLDKVTFKIDSKTRKVFDFLAVGPDGKTMHIEVERGTHTKEDFFTALDKIYQITKEFYFITPNEKVKKQHTKQKFFLWVNERLGGIQNADVVLHITTIDSLRKKPKNIWETTDLRNMEL